MKITIEPSPGDPHTAQYLTVTLDTRSNDESTHEAVAMMLDGLRSYGHNLENIAASAQEWAGEVTKEFREDL
jgi:hypothetical protein